jgi:V/A-type H+-transporting ATPase subunit I
MIVSMKKAVLFVMQQSETAALQKLKSLGLFHVDAAPRPAESLERLTGNKEQLERALLALPPPGKKEKPAPAADRAEPEELVTRILALKDRMDTAADEARRTREELNRLAPWGELDPARLADLRGRRIFAALFELNKKERSVLPPEAYVFRISERKGILRALVVSFLTEVHLPFKPVRLPAESTTALRARLERIEEELRGLRQALAAFTPHREALAQALAASREAVEFESVRLSMGADDRIVYLRGYLPVTAVEALQGAARAEGWGLMLSDPAPDEDVPTLVKNNRLISVVRPLFQFLGTVPGYKEKDISLFFLVFFSIFYGMIVGDAAYGFLYLGISVLIRLVGPRSQAKSRFASLLTFTSIATIVWGAMTGTWFGIDTRIILTTPPFSWFVVAPLVSTPQYDPATFLMHLCLIIGIIHLTLAHVWASLSKWPGLKCLADIGWIGVIWGGYFIIRYLVLKMDLFPAGPWIFGAGFLVVILFGEQEGKPVKGILLGFAKMPFTFLSSISAMADIISYVRLFALGLAGVKVEQAFNSIAAGMGFGFPNILGAGLILFFGHSLNLTLGIMSIIVHGVRLNMLEFSGHLGLEWSGREYKPFK